MPLLVLVSWLKQILMILLASEPKLYIARALRQEQEPNGTTLKIRIRLISKLRCRPTSARTPLLTLIIELFLTSLAEEISMRRLRRQ